MSFGASGVCMHPFIQEETDNIVLQINRFAPYVTGERTKIHISQAKHVVWADEEKETVPGGPMEADRETEAMARFLLDQIPRRGLHPAGHRRGVQCGGVQPHL